MAQISTLQPTGLPGGLRTFTAKPEAPTSIWTAKTDVSPAYAPKGDATTVYMEKTDAVTVWN